uniref:CIA30 domain-containing protein n=1 Tax=Steinernema glaseri TaxID=37863 RepID=A0A1I8AEP2_9BILA
MGNALEVSLSARQPVGGGLLERAAKEKKTGQCCGFGSAAAAARAVLMRAVVKKELCRSRMVAGTTFLTLALLGASLPSTAGAEARGFARVFSARSEQVERRSVPENDAPVSRSFISSLWIPFKLPWSREDRLPPAPPVDPIDAILNGSASTNGTQMVTMENGGEAFRIIDSDVDEPQQQSYLLGFRVHLIPVDIFQALL